MAKVVYLVGLCGSGKTRKGKSMEGEGWTWMGEGMVHTSERFGQMIGHLVAGRDCVCEEFQTLDPEYRRSIRLLITSQVPTAVVEFWFFEKDIVKATRNVLSRPDSKKDLEGHPLINGRNYDRYVIDPKLDTAVLPI